MMLTLFAMEHLEERKKSAQKYVKFFIADSVFSVFLPDYSHACRVVDYVLRLSLLRITSASVRACACICLRCGSITYKRNQDY